MCSHRCFHAAHKHLKGLYTDNLGTPRYGTSSAGSQVWAWNSDAFGNGTPSGSVTVNLRMAGQYHDAETGLFYNWNRYYNPEIGRYVSSDPIGLEGGINTFNYVEQNPLLYTDPEGLMIQLECAHDPLGCGTLEGGGSGGGAARGTMTGTSVGKALWGWCKGLVVNNEADDGPQTGNPDLDEVLKGSKAGKTKKGWETPGTKEELEEKIKNIPGAVPKTTTKGGTVITLPDGTKVSIYPERASSPGKPGWSVTRPNGKEGSGGKGSITGE